MVQPVSSHLSTKMFCTTSVQAKTIKANHGVQLLTILMWINSGETVQVQKLPILFGIVSFPQHEPKLLKYVFIAIGTSCDPTTTVATTIEPTTPCLTYTVAGNANGAFCQFPFRYKGTLYYECTRIDNKKLWCSTTSDYDIDEQWGVCSGNSQDDFYLVTCNVIGTININMSISKFQALYATLQVLLVRHSHQVAMPMELHVNFHSCTKTSCTTSVQG